MSNTRICTTNRAIGATILNGTGGSAPPLDEVSPYTMAQALTADRYTPWMATNPFGSGSPFSFDLDLGANRTIDAAAFLGYRPATTAGNSVLTVTVYSATSAVGYPPVSGGSWTSRGTISVSGAAWRDIGSAITSSNSRYFRFEMLNGGVGWSLGKLFLGQLTDLGAIHSPGGLFSPFRNRLETPQPGGAIVLQDLGDPSADFTLPFRTIQTSLRDTLANLQGQASTFLLVDAEDRFFEVFIVNGRVAVTRQYTSIFDVDMQLKAMP